MTRNTPACTFYTGVGNSADEYPIQSPHSSIGMYIHTLIEIYLSLVFMMYVDGDNMQAGGKKRTVSTGTYDSRSSIESAGIPHALA